MLAATKLALCVLAALAVWTPAAVMITSDGDMPYVDANGHVKCCIKMAVPVVATAPSTQGIPYIDQNGNLKCCIKPGLHANGSVHMMETASNNMLFHKDQHMPSVDSNGKVKCCIKHNDDDDTDRVPYTDKHGNVKCCIKRSEVEALVGGITDGGMPYEDANGNLKCCIKPSSPGGKWPVFLPSELE
jgi:hypothetical protein